MGRGIRIAPGAEKERRTAGGLGLRSEGVDLVLGREAFVGGSALQHLVRDLRVACDAGELADRLTTVPVEPEPFEPLEDRLRRLGRRAGAVGILDPQQERAARAVALMVPSEEPVEQCGAGAANMQKPGRRGGKAGDDRANRIWGVGHRLLTLA